MTTTKSKLIFAIVGMLVMALPLVTADEGYCNWQNCNGVAQGGDWCNQSQEICLACGGHGVEWCPGNESTCSCDLNSNEGKIALECWKLVTSIHSHQLTHP